MSTIGNKNAPDPLMRWMLINALIGRLGRACRYLEIGTQAGVCIRRISADDKWGVDPSNLKAKRYAKRFFKESSDDFFSRADELPTFDVVFIDGLHHHEQVMRDVEHALEHLAADGFVVLHDCNPPSEKLQRVPRPGPGPWNGDCWRAVVDLRQRDDIDVCVVDADEGLGIVMRRPPQNPLQGVGPAAALSYQQLEEHRRDWLNLLSEDGWARWCDGQADTVLAEQDRVVVLTALFGARDELRDPVKTFGGTRYVCFTDRDDLRSKTWEIHQLPCNGDPRWAARRVKILAHEYVDAERIVWVDASMRLSGDVRRLFQEGTQMAAFAHPHRSCLFEEIASCAKLGRAPKPQLQRQRHRYRNFPKKAGLFATGLIARVMTERIKRFNESWWDELQATTARDQISFPVALRRAGLRCDPLGGGNVYRNGYATYEGHAAADEAPMNGAAASGRPEVYTAIAYDEQMNLGRAYNRFMDLLPPGSWGCFVDHDAMFTTTSWYRQIADLIERNPNAGLLTVVTNRVANEAQVLDVMGHDLAVHRRRGQQLQAEERYEVDDITNGPLLSGVVMVLAKRAWEQAGGFRDGFLGVDNQMHLDVARAGMSVLLMRGVYVYHWYRAAGESKHIDTLPQEMKWRPR